MDNYYFSEWDEENFTIPKEYELTDVRLLADALNIFYSAGGYDFFNVVDPKYYSNKWLDFMGNLYSKIVDNKYCAKGKKYQIPLSNTQKKEFQYKGIPIIFLTDL